MTMVFHALIARRRDHHHRIAHALERPLDGPAQGGIELLAQREDLAAQRLHDVVQRMLRDAQLPLLQQLECAG